MVRHLEQVGFRLLFRDLLFRLSLCVSFQQGGCFSVNQFHHQGFIVAPRGQVLRARSQDSHLCPAKVKLITRLMLDHAHPQFLRLLPQGFHLRIRGIAQPQLPRPEVGQDGSGPALVIGMRVRDGNRVEMADATRPQIGRHHVFADIQIRMYPLRQASSVHQQNAAGG